MINTNTPSFTTTALQAFDKVKNGEWTAEQFTRWYEMHTQDAYNHGKDAGYEEAQEQSEKVMH
jgi:hypothetical protein